MTKIDIISGFLGAGKTTLIKKLLDESFKDEKLRAGEITREDYDCWRYTYPEMKAQQTKDRLDALRIAAKDAETAE